VVTSASSVAIIGAGVSGLACARALKDAGHEPVVFEKSRFPGGRAAARLTELGSFDHGAQYFTVKSDSFAKVVTALRDGGYVAAWSARAQGAADDDGERLVGVPNMQALGHGLAAGLDVRYDQRVTRLERVLSTRPAKWSLRRVGYDAQALDIEVTEGLFDAVAVALPPAQALELLDVSKQIAARVRSVPMRPCWALMLGFAEELDTPYDSASLAGPRLAWIARDSSKPGRRTGERWVAHATPTWSEEHLLDDPEDVRAKLVKAFREATKTPLQPVHAVVHRWRYSLVEKPLSDGFLWDAKLRVGACGDWCSGARIESAWVSGDSLGRDIAKALDKAGLIAAHGAPER
jgi:renalase